MLRFVFFIALFAAVLYAAFWLLDRRKGGGGTKGVKPIPRGPVGPDDDEDFLRELERRRRHSNNGRPKDAQPKNTPPKNAPPTNGSGPRPAPDQHPKSSQAEDAKAKDAQPEDARPEPQPNTSPKDGQPNDGEA